MNPSQKWYLLPLVLLLVISFASCSPEWQRKFIRQKKDVQQSAQFQLQAKYVPYDVLYKRHLNAWRNWHRELIRNLDGNHKKEIQCLRETRRHLSVLSKYLVEEKKDEVKDLVREFDDLTKYLKRGKLDTPQYGRLGRRLEALERKIDNTLRISKREKEDFLAAPIPMDMDEYAGEEPLELEAKEVKSGSEPADIPTDGELSYEEYRTLTF